MLRTEKTHEIRIPVHGFIRCNTTELDLINSEPFQRLRHIKQLGLAYYVYPGAVHTRFEHSLGVMHLANQVFRTITNEYNIVNEPLVQELFNRTQPRQLLNYGQVLRVAALCHDMGHMPLSHATESVLPNHWNHEHYTLLYILTSPLRDFLHDTNIDPVAVAKISVGPDHIEQYATDLDGLISREDRNRLVTFTTWEYILSDIITGNAFGVDRIDFLLRDAHHTGLTFGQVEHARLIDCLRILPDHTAGNTQLVLGLTEGGVRSAQHLAWARYLMYTELYFHPAIRIYELHLADFTRKWIESTLPDGKFPLDLQVHQGFTDHELEAAIRTASKNHGLPGHTDATRITDRKLHYRSVYRPNLDHLKLAGDDPVIRIYDAVEKQFDGISAMHEEFDRRGSFREFTVYSKREEKPVSSTAYFKIEDIPQPIKGGVYVSLSNRTGVLNWLRGNMETILKGDLE